MILNNKLIIIFVSLFLLSCSKFAPKTPNLVINNSEKTIKTKTIKPKSKVNIKKLSQNVVKTKIDKPSDIKKIENSKTKNDIVETEISKSQEKGVVIKNDIEIEGKRKKYLEELQEILRK